MKEDPDLLDQSIIKFAGDPHKFYGQRPEDVDVENFPDGQEFELVSPEPEEEDPEEEGQNEDQEEETSGEGETVDSEDTASNVSTNNISVSVENSALSPTFFLSGFPGMNTSWPMGQNSPQQGQMSQPPQVQAQQPIQSPQSLSPALSQNAISAPTASLQLPSSPAVYSSPPVASFSSAVQPTQMSSLQSSQLQSYPQSTLAPAMMQQTYPPQTTVSSPVSALSPMMTSAVPMMASGAMASVPQSRPIQQTSENPTAPTSTPAAKPQVSIPADSTPVAVAKPKVVSSQPRTIGSPLNAVLRGFTGNAPTLYSPTRSNVLRPAVRSGSVGRVGTLNPAKTSVIGGGAVGANPLGSLLR